MAESLHVYKSTMFKYDLRVARIRLIHRDSNNAAFSSNRGIDKGFIGASFVFVPTRKMLLESESWSNIFMYKTAA